MPPPHRIRPQSRPLRPPSTKHYRATRARFFARNPHLLLVSNNTVRPQLGFLTSSTRLAALSPFQQQLARFLSTKTRDYIREQSWLAGKYTIIGGIVITCGLSWAWMLTQEMVDREFPAPREWSFLTKVVYHCARGLEVPGANPDGVVSWWATGNAYRRLLSRLEDPEIDGQGVVVQDEADVLIPGMGHTGFDIEGKSYEWKRGYYDTLMGCGRAAIELEEAVLDPTQEYYVFRRSYVVGPSNPRPKKLPKKVPKHLRSPREEDCIPAYAPPETYYLKILTTKGFTNKEKMDAALAYGNWLDFKGLTGTAGEMFQWALDLATSGVEDSAKILDRKTAIIKPDAPVTENILDATTALAVHRAQTGDVGAALPMFLSILRARREAPLSTHSSSPTALPQTRNNKIKRTDIEVMQAQMSSFWALLQASKFPDPAPSGNTRFERTPDAACDEAAVMTYIGELLFAVSADQRDAGLSWTKSALELAYTGYGDPRTRRESKLKCVSCLRVARANRRKMVDLRIADVKEREEERKQASAWQRWVPGLLVGEAALAKEKQRWEGEEGEMRDFEDMLFRGRVFDVQEEPKPLWGSSLLREYLLNRFSKPDWEL